MRVSYLGYVWPVYIPSPARTSSCDLSSVQGHTLPQPLDKSGVLAGHAPQGRRSKGRPR